MVKEDPNSRLRGHKEIIKGKVVDRQGVHIDENAIEDMLLKATQGQLPSISDEEDVILSKDAEKVNGKMVDEDGVHLSKDDLLASLLSNSKTMPSNPQPKKGNDVQKSANINVGMFQPIWDELQKFHFQKIMQKN
jgi:hypothetical protein